MSSLSEALWGGEQLGQARGVRGSTLAWCWGARGVPVGCAPTASQEPAQAEEGGVWVVWILASCFGLGRSF